MILFCELTRQEVVTPRSGWRDKQRALYVNHWKTLPDNYFPARVARLRGLRRWSQGRSSRLKPDAELTHPVSPQLDPR